jgi:hypothetical protein
VGRGVGVDAMAELVYGDVMVIPAEGDQVVGRVITAIVLLVDVVDLETVA